VGATRAIAQRTNPFPQPGSVQSLHRCLLSTTAQWPPHLFVCARAPVAVDAQLRSTRATVSHCHRHIIGGCRAEDSQQEERGSPAGYYAGSIASRGLGCVLMLHPTATGVARGSAHGPLATSARGGHRTDSMAELVRTGWLGECYQKSVLALTTYLHTSKPLQRCGTALCVPIRSWLHTRGQRSQKRRSMPFVRSEPVQNPARRFPPETNRPPESPAMDC